MTKAALIDAVASASDISKKAAGEAVNAVFANIASALKKGDKVTIPGFGTFKVSSRAARTGVNPQTGAAMNIPAMDVARFTPGKALKDSLR